MQAVRPHYAVNRPAYSQPEFDEEFDRKRRSFPLGDKVKKVFSCSSGRLKSLLFRHLPVLSWLPKYNFRQNLLTDVISGVSAGTIQVPQGMAFALLANLPPVNGLYSSFFPLIPYFFMGTAHQMVPGTFAVLSIMVGMVCLRLAPESDFSHFNATLNATVVDEEKMNEVRLGISGTLACLTAIIQTLIDICRGLPETNLASLVFALVSSVVLITVKELSARYRHKIPFPIPMEIIIVVVATAISGPLDLPEKYHMDIVGQIPLGFPAPILPTVSQWEDMLSTAFSLAIVGYVINLAMGRTLAAKHGYDVDPNQEMLALGFSNFLGGFFKIHVICCALSVTLAVDSAGGSSQFASLCVMLVVMVTMLALGAYLKPLPKSVLGALIAVNLKNTLLQLSDPYYLWKKSKLDCCVWVVSFLATFFLSLPFGVAIGVGFSILVVIFQTQFRNGSEVAQVMDTDLYKNPKVYNKTGLDPGKVLLARKKFLKKQQDKEKQEIKSKQSQTISQIDLQSDFYTIGADMPTSYVNPYCDITGSAGQLPDPVPTSPPSVTIEMQPMPFHTLILDLAGVCFIDLMGIKVLTKMSNTYSMLGISLYLANVHAQVLEELEAGGIFVESSLTPSHLFLSVHDAVLFAQHKSLTSDSMEETDKERMKLAFDIQEEELDLEQELF
ncbi:hypothetical protein MHYP_G00082390 [Metynnis hypsauchen]